MKPEELDQTTIELPRTPPVPRDAESEVPRMECLPLKSESKRPAVLICPGGGYGMRAPHEGITIAERVNAAGFHAFVLHYRVAPFRHPQPLQDAVNAMNWIRSQSAALQIGPIFVIGFSAGGHLAASLSLLWDSAEIENSTDASRPDGTILCYPVISAGSSGHRGSFLNLLGPDGTPDAMESLSLEKRARADAPPCFMWHTANDAAVPVENTLLLRAALASLDVPVEVHIYPDGRHGLGLAEDQPGVRDWFPRAMRWIEETTE